MGRVARYKKVKSSCKGHDGGEYVWGETESRKRKKKSATAEKFHRKKLKRRNNNNESFEEGFDMPPSGKDDFDLSNLIVRKGGNFKAEGTVKSKRTSASLKGLSSSSFAKPSAKVTKDSVQVGNQAIPCHIPESDKEERQFSRLLNIDPKSGATHRSKKKSAITTLEGRKEGESFTAFKKRLREETKMALIEDKLKTRKMNIPDDETLSKAQRRKNYLNMKKKKKKGSALTHNSVEEIGLDEGEVINRTEQFSSVPSFLDQVEQPPIFKQLPRGSEKKPSGKRTSHKSDTNESKIRAEQNSMEALRREVQTQYSIIKAKRKKGRNFHL